MLSNSLKQIFKKPLKVLLFLLLIIVSVIFLSLGVYLYASIQQNLDEADSIFTTVGRIEQRIVGQKEYLQYDAIEDVYTANSSPTYGEPISLNTFDFDGANYIFPPQNEPYYIARSEKYTKGWRDVIDENAIDIMEYKVVEMPEDVWPVRAEVTKAFSGTYKEGDTIWVCMHYSETRPFELGKTYISCFQMDTNLNRSGQFDTNYHKLANYTALNPIVPYSNVVSAQIDENGKWLDEPVNEADNTDVFEVTEGFYESVYGKKLLAFANSEVSLYTYYPKLRPTDSMDLISEYYDRDLLLEDGRYITQDEFDNGKTVCMIDSEHAEFNNLGVGDTVDFQFLSTVYGNSLGNMMTAYGAVMSHDVAINSQGEIYEPFFEEDYEIVGIYKSLNQSDYTLNPYFIGYGTIIIPSKSMTGNDNNNMNGNLDLKPYNTAFTIPNGTSGAYMEKLTQKLSELGFADRVTVTFSDRGYENIKAGLLSIQTMAITLMITGIITTAAVLFFFAFIFVGKEKVRIAVERSLGVTKVRSGAFIMIGVMIIVIIAAAIGTGAGFTAGSGIMDRSLEMSDSDQLSTEFSNWIGTDADSSADEDFEIATNTMDTLTPIAIFSIVVMASVLIIGFFVINNLRKEPMQLLSERKT